MSWTRLDDLWTEHMETRELSLSARWHYLCLVQRCSRLDLRDGAMRRKDARRVSDVDDPEAALAELLAAGLLTADGGDVTVVDILDHLPTEAALARKEANRERQQRHWARERAHAAEDHSLCVTGGKCEAVNGPAWDITRDVAPTVTRDIGTGQDGPGQGSSTPVTPRTRTDRAVVSLSGRTKSVNSSPGECLCRMTPCACAYVLTLRPDGTNAALRDTALAMRRIAGGHRPGCPCPRCWSARAATWGRAWTA